MIRSSLQKSYGVSHAATEPDKVRTSKEGQGKERHVTSQVAYAADYDDRQASRQAELIGRVRAVKVGHLSSAPCTTRAWPRQSGQEERRGIVAHAISDPSLFSRGRLQSKHGQPLLVAVEKMDHGLD
jgi:hypothetical protein